MVVADNDQAREAYQALLDAAAPIAQLESAWLAENATSMLLGGVYWYATGGDRRTLMADFVDNFVKFLVRRRSPEAEALLAGLAGVAPGGAAERAARAVQRREQRDSGLPRWAAEVGKVRCTGAWQVTDRYGDQTHYLVTFGYDNPEAGGPDHSIGILVDHNLRLVVDMVTGAPAAEVVAGWQQTCALSEGALTLTQLEPVLVRAYVEQHLRNTEAMPQPPGGQQYLDHWAMTVSRLALLPDASGDGPPVLSEAARDAVVAAFLQSPEGRHLTTEQGCQPAVAQRAARAAVDYTVTSNSGDPLRWSPIAVGLFLELAPTRDDLSAEVGSWLPEVLEGFVAYAGQAKGLPDEAIAATRAAVTTLAERYATKMAGREQSESFDAVLDKMIADGVDPGDDEAARAWLARYLETEQQKKS